MRKKLVGAGEHQFNTFGKELVKMEQYIQILVAAGQIEKAKEEFKTFLSKLLKASDGSFQSSFVQSFAEFGRGVFCQDADAIMNEYSREMASEFESAEQRHGSGA